MTSVEALERLKDDPVACKVMGKFVFRVAAFASLAGMAVGYTACLLIH